MSIPNRLAAYAANLLKAEADATPIAPLTDDQPPLDEPGAYEVQSINLRHRLDRGEKLRGWKVGLTSKAMQRQLGVEQPDYGYVLDSMMLPSGGSVSMSRLISPLVEAELTVRTAVDLTAPITESQARGAIDRVYASLEVIDSRIKDWKIQLPDTIADNASCARVVLGDSAVGDELVLPEIQMALSRNGSIEDCGTGAAVLGDPIRCVVWLVNRLGELGQSVSAGQLLMTGALHQAIPVSSGDEILAQFSGLGSVSMTVAA